MKIFSKFLFKGLFVFLAMSFVGLGLFSCANEDSSETTYTVTYVSEYGSAPSAIAVSPNTILSSSQLPSLAATGTEKDISFSGWYDGDKKAVAGEYTVTNDVTLTAKWGYRIIFDTVEKTYLTSDSSKTAKHPSLVTISGSSFTESDITTAMENYSLFDGYAISGWYFDINYTNPFADFTVEKPVTLYAKLTYNGSDVNIYKITYENTEATTEIAPQTSTGLITASNYTRGEGKTTGISGKLFCGWYYDKAYTNPVLWGQTITADTTFYAKWINTADLASSANGGTFMAQDYSSLVSDGVFYTRTDEKDSEVGQRIYTKATELAKNTDYFSAGLHYFSNVLFYSESFSTPLRIKTNSSNKTNSSGIRLDPGTTASILSDGKLNLSLVKSFAMVTLTKKGTLTLEFANSASSSCTTNNSMVYLVTADGNILASKNIDNRNGSGSIDYTLSATTEAANVFILLDRNGDNGGGINIKSISFKGDSSIQTSTIKLYGAGLTRDSNGLAQDPSISLENGTTFTQTHINTAMSSYTVKDGYTLDGWYFDPDYTEAFSEFEVKEQDVLYAKYSQNGNKVKLYKITYSNSENSNTPVQLCSNVVTKASYVTGNYITFGIEGKIFCGWYYDSSCTRPVMTGDSITEDKTFYAKWLNVSDLSVETSSSGVNFLEDNSNLARLASEGSLCKRKSNDKDPDVGEHIYEVISAPMTQASHFFMGGVHNFDGALIWSPNYLQNVEVYTFNRDPVVTNRNGIRLEQSGATLFSSDDTSKVNLSLARSFVMVKMPQTDRVSVTLLSNKNDKVTSQNAKAYLVKADGTILSETSIDNRGSNESNTEATLAASNIEKDTKLFVVFCRNGDNGGAVRVKKISFGSESSESNTGTNTESETTGNPGSTTGTESNTGTETDSSTQYFYIKLFGAGLTRNSEGLAADTTISIINGTVLTDDIVTAAFTANSFTVKDGYSLAGWYLDPGYSQSCEGYTVTGNKNLYAKFTQSGNDVTVYKITYVNTEATNEIAPQTSSGLITSSNYILGTGISRGINGKLFCGWYYDEAYTNPVLWNQTITADTTFYAKWVNTADLATPSASATFADQDYSSLASNGVFYTRTAEKVSEVGRQVYTKVTELTTNTNYYACGLQTFSNVLFYSESFVTPLQIKTNSSSINTDSKGIVLDPGNTSSILSDGKINLSLLRSFAMVTLTKSGTVTLNFMNGTSSGCTTTNAMVYLAASDGTILASKNIDNRSESGSIDYTISATTEAGNVFIFIDRNGDKTGGIKLVSTSFVES
ncbi:MAG: InlB B-repeat-containing protein [Treponema sp.]|nr:InlB B-repeat-containing protein [Treponema sp.]